MTPVSLIGTDFQISSVWHGWDCAMTTVTGDIRAGSSAERFARHLQWVFALGARYLVVDLSAVRRCEPPGLSTLLDARADALERQGWVCLSGRKSLLDQLDGFASQPTTLHDVEIAY